MDNFTIIQVFNAVRENNPGFLQSMLIGPQGHNYANASNGQNQRPLDVALSMDISRGIFKRRAVFEVLLRRGAYITAENIVSAAQFSNDEIVRMFCYDRDNINTPNAQDWNPLQIALTMNFNVSKQVRTIRNLLNNGADPNANCPSTALHIAVNHARVPIIFNELLQSNANINAVNPQGSTPLSCAAGIGNEAIVETLLMAGADPNWSLGSMQALHKAFDCIQTDVFERLLNAGANIDAPNDNGDSTLHRAVKNGDIEFVEILIRHGCNIDLRNRIGETALHLALRSEDEDIMRTLLDANANVNIRDEEGMTPLHHSVSSDLVTSQASFELLSRTKPNMHIKDCYGRTTLYLALINKANLGLIYCLIRKDPTQVDFEGLNILNPANLIA